MFNPADLLDRAFYSSPSIDDLTPVLLFVLASLLIYHRFFSVPSPIVHPLLLGKQSDVSSVRKKGESGVYRNWATGQGSPFTVRPANGLKIVGDVVKPDDGKVVQRCVLDTLLSDEALAEIIRLLPIGLTTLFPLSLSPTSSTPILTLLPPVPSTSLPLLLLYLSAPPSCPVIPLPSPLLLSTALTSTAHPKPGLLVVYASLLDDVLEQVFEDCKDKVGIVVIGDEGKKNISSVQAARGKGLTVHWWEEIWDVAEEQEEKAMPDAHFNDVHSYFYNTTSADTKTSVVKVTHMNITAGIASVLSLFPADKRPSSALKDVVASSSRLDTPFGMTIALASIWSGAGFRLIGPSTATWPNDDIQPDQGAELLALADVSAGQPKPTIMFINSVHHLSLLHQLHLNFLSHPLNGLVTRVKAIGVSAGHISRDSTWDKLVLNGLRERHVGGLAGKQLRALIVVGDAPAASSLGLSHILLSLPLSRLHPSPYSTGPIFVSHFNDLQTPSMPDLFQLDFRGNERAHVGPPASNVEVVLKGSEEEFTKDSDRQTGRIWARGPGIVERIGGEGVIEGWTDLEEEASVQTNGTFVIHQVTEPAV